MMESVVFKYVSKLLGRYHAGLAPDRLAVPEKYQRGYPLDLESLGCVRISVYIYFDDLHPFANLFLDLLQNGGHHLAGTAPGSREIYENRRISLQ
jgi:hypothetical protein